ncbi:hypothetical protein ACIQCR_11980 [Streptomyces sp. NPDC093249]|uniref:hypothetical protein n=1 Tax=unclassified Streptomyces TaxID=2593676 RepID=UPI0038093F44
MTVRQGRFGVRVGGGTDGSSVPDDEWDRFLKESVAGVRGAPEEPSARAREAAGRLRDRPGDTGGRTPTPPPRRRGKGRYAVGLAAALALMVVAFDPWGFVRPSGDGGRAERPLAQESERPTGAPPAGPDGRPTRAEPFRGSPAERWADGTAGITVPAARATGWMDEAQVEKALRRSLDFLAASNLDPGVLRGGHPAKAIALVNPHQRDVQEFLATSLRTPGKEKDPLRLFSRLDPASAQLVGDVVRTRGRITYEEGERGALRVAADVTYVYPVARGSGADDEVVRIIVRRETVLSWDDPAKVVTEPGTLSLVSYLTDMTNTACDRHTGYFVPVFASDRPTTGPANGVTVDPYDRSGSLAETTGAGDRGCGTATRS